MPKSARQILTRKAESPIILDGGFGEMENGSESVTFEGRPLAGHARRATVHTMWDPKNLYLAFDVHSPKLRAEVHEHDGDRLWEDDSVEFLIDAHHDRASQFLPGDFAYHTNILNVVYDDRGTPSGQPDSSWNGQALHIVKLLDDYRYAVEVAIPWTEIGLEPRDRHTSIGLDSCVNGRDPQTNQYDYFNWCGLTVFHDPSGFGDLILAGPRAH
jgi:hypothetical protein